MRDISVSGILLTVKGGRVDRKSNSGKQVTILRKEGTGRPVVRVTVPTSADTEKIEPTYKKRFKDNSAQEERGKGQEDRD
jgi:hypothetical protein